MDFNAMFFLNSLLLGVGLSMDAFSVSLANGLNEPKMRKAKPFAIAGTFAFFQALMPMLGWLCVHTIVEKFTVFEKFIPYIALALLGFIGAKMIIECVKERKNQKKTAEKTQNSTENMQNLTENTQAEASDMLNATEIALDEAESVENSVGNEQNSCENALKTTETAAVLDVTSGSEQSKKKKLSVIALLVQGIATSIDALSVGFTIAEYKVFSALVCAAIIATVTFAISLCGVFLGRKFGVKFSGKAEIVGGIILIGIGLEIFIKSFF